MSAPDKWTPGAAIRKSKREGKKADSRIMSRIINHTSFAPYRDTRVGEQFTACYTIYSHFER